MRKRSSRDLGSAGLGVALALTCGAALASTDGLESNDVHVTTDRATVTLTGTVADAAQRERAGSIVQHLDGVTSVTNLLQVGKPSH